jgi:hypothetical protein
MSNDGMTNEGRMIPRFSLVIGHSSFVISATVYPEPKEHRSMPHDAANQKTLNRAFAPTAIPVARSFALMAFFLTCCGCTVNDGQPSENRRRVEVKVNVELNRRPRCPDGTCPKRANFRFSILDFELSDIDSRCHRTNPKSKIQNPKSPAMDLPVEARCRNYAGGSCVCASTISLLRWQGCDELAAELRRTCVGGQSAGSLHAHLDALGVRYAFTTSGDVAFLEWAIRTRRGCGVTFYPAHYVNLVDLTDEEATLLDNNRVEQYVTMPRDEFIRRWRGYGGWATAVVYSPAAPVAHRNHE